MKEEGGMSLQGGTRPACGGAGDVQEEWPHCVICGQDTSSPTSATCWGCFDDAVAQGLEEGYPSSEEPLSSSLI